MSETQSRYRIEIEASPEYLESESDPDRDRYVFAYTITIRNRGRAPAKLLSRRWYVSDGDGHTQEVTGEGVVGKQPYLRPGESFEYTSGAAIATPVGAMRGTYRLVTDDGEEFDAEIPPFTLAVPNMLQ